MHRRFLMTCAAGLAAAAGGTASLGQNIGPSTTTAPYVLPMPHTGGAVTTTSILTVGDNVNGYRLVGIPDGMGGLSNGNGTFEMFVNHELGASVGTTRAHGSTGAFVSRWTIGNNLAVQSGRDHNQNNTSINTWNGAGYTAGTTAYARLCSADLPAQSAFQFGGLGTPNRIFMNGEETGPEGRAFAHVVTGPDTDKSWQLPRLGRFSWENSVASPFAQQKTVVIGTDDATPGQVYMYVGNKTDSGNDVERAGLTNGNLYGVRVNSYPLENRPAAAAGRFDLFNKGDVSNQTGAQVQTNSVANGVTEFLRPEDGAWDPRPGRQNDFYFVTTDRFNSPTQQGNSRLYRMRFDDITNPTAGGEITMMVDGFTAGPTMMDNLCIDSHGRVLIQEDIGGQDPLGKIWLYDIDSGGLVDIAQHSSTFFTPGAPGFLTRDEEASGIFDAKDLLGDGWFLMNSQAHYAIAGELVEGGQLLAMYVAPNLIPTPSAAGLLGLGLMAAGRRRRR